jgi:hypothetical protein
MDVTFLEHVYFYEKMLKIQFRGNQQELDFNFLGVGHGKKIISRSSRRIKVKL